MIIITTTEITVNKQLKSDKNLFWQSISFWSCYPAVLSTCAEMRLCLVHWRRAGDWWTTSWPSDSGADRTAPDQTTPN